MKMSKKMARKVDLRQLKPAGTYPDLHEKLCRELSVEYERERDSDYVAVSWANQERAQEYFNAHGFVATLDHMLRLRGRNDGGV